ncbi:MAG: hypothetical protein JXR70_19555 [Spirochaetales bacterium]|nr:hypothetical protein [Spirochaetales bacterium]
MIQQCRPIMEQARDFARQQDDMVSIPFYGQIAGGQPLLIEDYLGETVGVPRDILIGRDHYFAVRVMGDSMEGAGIHHQDVIILRVQNTAENGQIAAVNYHGEATLKRVYHRGDIIELHPCNPSHQMISLPAREVKIQGLFIKVLDMAASA